MRPFAGTIVLVLSFSLVGTQSVAQDTAPSAPPTEGAIQLPPAPPIPPTPPFLPPLEDPKENPTTPEKVQLGYILFFEKLLS
jgi:hypothetical protein